MNDRFLKALWREPVDRTPLWLMRQAGRYLPEYRQVREKAGDFLNLCMTPDLACEVTLQPLRRYNFDAAILFSDILTIPHAMNLGLSFLAGEGPVFTKPIKNSDDIASLPIPDPEGELKYVMDAVRLIKKELHGKVPLIGFAGSPWTIATYMVEGQSSKTFSKIKKMMYSNPVMLHALLIKLTEAITLYLKAQIAAGCDVIMLFDSWGGILTKPAYLEFSLAYMKKIVQDLQAGFEEHRPVPIILFSKQANCSLIEMAETGCQALGVDWTMPLALARDVVNGRVALQGNLDPSVLYGDEKTIRASVDEVMSAYNGSPGHIFNLGHGVYPDISLENVSILVDAVRSWKK